MDVGGELQVLLVRMRQAEIREEVARDRLAHLARWPSDAWLRNNPPDRLGADGTVAARMVARDGDYPALAI